MKKLLEILFVLIGAAILFITVIIIATNPIILIVLMMLGLYIWTVNKFTN